MKKAAKKEPMTNTEHLVNVVKRALEEPMEIFVNGDPNNKGYIVIHEGTGYVVSLEESGIKSCTCPHHVYRNLICKHMIKVGLEKGLNLSEIPQTPINDTDPEPIQEPINNNETKKQSA